MSALKKMVLLLTAVAVSAPLWAKVELEYFYADDGTLTGRAVNGVRQNFVYDKRGQLLAVKDARGNDIERYVYDPAGNILSKTIGGVTTKYTYDKANQLLTSTRNGKVTRYEYDAAGRLIREGDRVYFYGYQDKILTVTVNGKKKLTFDYHMDGQLASAGGNGKSEEFLWDGLALIKRGNTRYVNEPYVTGGNPVIAGNDVMFNDMLGSTVAINDKAVGMTSFGETVDSKAMYTGKPYVDGLGYAFLFRNYRTDLGKWQTVDPLGYPDGWNNLAYCNNDIIEKIDFAGASIIDFVFSDAQGVELFNHWLYGKGALFKKENDPSWSDYMRANSLLIGQVERELIKDYDSRSSSGTVNITFYAEIENGYFSGYQMLHGTNSTVGDFNINGTATVSIDSIGNKTITYDVTEAWNDIIDPNSTDLMDILLSYSLGLIYSPTDYIAKISWNRKWILE